MKQNVQLHTLTNSNVGITNVIKTPISIINKVNNKEATTSAIWDTGATGSVITEKLALELELVPVCRFTSIGVHGPQEVNGYYVQLVLNNGNITFPLRVSECKSLSDGTCDFLIGMDVITKGDFAITNYENNTVMSFRLPSIQKIDFCVVDSGKSPIISTNLLGRNAPCYCGSGKKLKHCHAKK